MPIDSWQKNYDKIKMLRRDLRKEYGFHISEEMYTKHFLSDKDPYMAYKWSKDVKCYIVKKFAKTIKNLDISIVNVIIDITLFNRIGRLIDKEFVCRVMATLKDGGVINLKANQSDKYGLVIYPKK